MRLHVEGRKGLLIAKGLLGGSLALMAGAAAAWPPTASARPNGPQADYPVLVGDPYTIAGATYTPVDVLNYDEVGYTAPDNAGGATISASHHTLPLPSYAEVTSLESGRTILVRVERRGPMDGNQLIALSPGALAQLEAAAETPVRVRRVNPPEDQRAMLRAGEPAPLRMDTPMSLVQVLKRKLPSQGALPSIEAVNLEPSPTTTAVFADAPIPQAPAPQGFPNAPPPAATSAEQAPASDSLFVQAATFSTRERAERAAEPLDGVVLEAGRYFRVRTGPFSTRAEAEASLAKVRDAGYSDARILTNR